MEGCCICLEAYSDDRVPVVTPCGHTVCKTCAASSPSHQCPVCRGALPVGQELPVNFALKGALAALAAAGAGVPTAAAPSPARPAVLPGPAINPNDLLIPDDARSLGTASYGKVVIGRYPRIEPREVAVKLLPLPEGNSVGDVQRRRQLHNEVELLARASAQCEHVCRLHGVCTVQYQHREWLAVVMRLYPTSLKVHLEDQPGGRLGPGAARLLALDLLRGLAELHSVGIVMADLKPDNVLLDNVSSPVLADFGISRAVTNTMGAQVTQLVGTPQYMSPEQFVAVDDGAPQYLTPQADMWAFAATMLHVLTGALPWPGLTAFAIVRKVGVENRSPELPLDLPPDLRALMVECFNVKPTLRPTARGAFERLQAALGGQHVPVVQHQRQPHQQDMQRAPHVVAMTMAPDPAYKDGKTPLHWAARNGDVKVVRAQLQAGANIEAADQDGLTPLHWAAQYGGVEVLRALLRVGANKEAVDKDRKTPLHTAALHGRVDTLRALLDAQANKEAVDTDGSTPLHWAAKTVQVQAVVVQALLEAKANKEAVDEAGMTPLLTAAQHGRMEVVTVLLGVGANKEAADKAGMTSLHHAARNVRVDVVRALLRASVNLEAAEKTGKTPLHIASECGRLEVVQVLLEARANKEAVDQDRMTPLHTSIQHGRLEVARMLLKCGADKEALGKGGITPLHTAARYGRTELVRKLRKTGANKEARDEAGMTPLHWAAQCGSVDAVRVLLRAGANKEAVDTSGRTASDIAATCKHTAVVELLGTTPCFRCCW